MGNKKKEKIDIKNFVKRNSKDSVFTNLFSIPKYKRELYLSLHPKDKSVTEDEIQTLTLQNIITNGVVNDLSILVRSILFILMEAQSSWNENMPIRMLEYLAESINRYLKQTKQRILRNTKVSLPKIELYLLYTGKKKIKKDWLSLKEEFFANDENCPIDLKIRVITLTKKDNILNEYINFTKIYDKNVEEYGHTAIAIQKTIKECIEKGILVEYLLEKRVEVEKIMLTLFDQETATEEMLEIKYEDGYEKGTQYGMQKGMQKGMQQGMQQGKIDLLLDMVKKKIIDIEYAVKESGMSNVEFKKLMKKA